MERGQQVSSLEELVVGQRFSSHHYLGTKTDPFRGHPFRVLSQPFWAINSFNRGVDLQVAVEVEGYDGPTGGICMSGDGFAIAILCANNHQNIRAQAIPVARLGIDGCGSYPRSNETFRLLD
jgi:hypothetical protein